jgi:hypothetical protein
VVVKRVVALFAVFLPLILGGGEMPVLPSSDIFPSGMLVAPAAEWAASVAYPSNGTVPLVFGEQGSAATALFLPRRFNTVTPLFFGDVMESGDVVLTFIVSHSVIDGATLVYDEYVKQVVAAPSSYVLRRAPSINVHDFFIGEMMTLTIIRYAGDLEDTLDANLSFVGWLFE